MKRLFRVSLLIISIFFCYKSSIATHIMGADLSYSCLGGNTYEFKLTVYRNCSGEEVDNQTELFFRSASCNIPEFSLQAQWQAEEEIALFCESSQNLTSCNGGPLRGIQQHTYTVTHTFPENCEDWIVSWRLCCRNQGISTLLNPAEERLYIEAVLNTQDADCNQSPIFSNVPIPVVCAGEPNFLHHGIVDPDRDSLSFELVDPLSYVGSEPVPVTFLPPFYGGNPISTDPPSSFSIDPASGQLSFTSQNIQQGILAVKVNEFRNGQWIGSTMRDMQLIVVNCENKSPEISLPSNANTNPNTSSNQSFSICVGNEISFSGQVVDPEGELLTLETNLTEQIPNAIFNVISNNGIRQWDFSWTPNEGDIGDHFFNMLWKDNGCPIVGKQSLGFHIRVDQGNVLAEKIYDYCPEEAASIQVEASTPVDNGISYEWFPNTGLSDFQSRSPVAQLDSTHHYSVIARNGTSCPIIEPITIRPYISLDFPQENLHICAGGSIELPVAFKESFNPNETTLRWSPTAGLNNPNILNPIASPENTQQYTLTVTTPNCVVEKQVFVIVDPPLQIEAFEDRRTCQGIPINLLDPATVLPISTFQWNPTIGLDDPNKANPIALPEGNTTYTMTATNACGQLERQVDVIVAPPLNATVEVEAISCADSQDGMITAYGAGGVEPISFTWLPINVSQRALENIGEGNYTLIATDAAGCVDTVEVEMEAPDTLGAVISRIVPISCAGQSDGAIQVEGFGGTPPYSFELNDSIFVTSNFFTALSSGTYTLTVKDANGCSATLPPILLEEGTPFDITLVNKVDASCNSPLGEIEVEALGGRAPYMFSIDGETYTPELIYTGLGPGTYIVSAEDQNLCVASMEIEIREIEDPRVVVDSIGEVTCAGFSDGWISFTGEGGVGPYTYTLDSIPQGVETVFDSLDAGRHELILTDALGCNYTVAFDIPSPDELALIQSEISLPTCHGGNNGFVRLLGWGGIGPYEYAGPDNAFNPSPQFENLSGGIQQFRIRDQNQCEDTVQIEVRQPDPVTFSIDTLTTPVCNGEYNGQLVILAQGGYGDYSYTLSDQIFSTIGQFTNLGAGTYEILVKDVKGCSVDSVIVIEEPDVLLSEVIDQKNLSCFGGKDGRVSLSAEGGVPTYTIRVNGEVFDNQLIVNDLTEGLHLIEVEDANGCIKEHAVTIQAPPPLQLQSEWEQVSCYGAFDGMAEVNPRGGVLPYSYQWSNGAQEDRIEGLGPGTLEVEVTDANGCLQLESFEIYEPEEMVIDSIIIDSVSCFGQNDGFVEVQASGGDQPLTFAWSHGPVDSILNNIRGGNYELSIFDAGGCELFENVEVFEPEALEIQILDSLPATCNQANGRIALSALGGRAPYFYYWDEPLFVEDSVITGLDSGTYTIFVSDANGCEERSTIDVRSIPEPISEFEIETTPDSLIAGNPIRFVNQSLFASNYEWDFGDGNVSAERNPHHVFDEAGEFAVRLISRDLQSLCDDFFELSLTILPEGKFFIANAFTPNSDGVNDSFIPKGEGIQTIVGNIYNRWGELIYQFLDPEKGWPGITFNGQSAPKGVYVYQIQVHFQDGRSFVREGTVTLIR